MEIHHFSNMFNILEIYALQQNEKSWFLEHVKKFVVKVCGSIDHASSYFLVQLELYNTLLQEVGFL